MQRISHAASMDVWRAEPVRPAAPGTLPLTGAALGAEPRGPLGEIMLGGEVC